MNSLSATELSRMRSAAAETFFDACKLGTPSGGGWGTDPGDKTYSYGSEISCGFDAMPAGEAQDGTQAPMVDAVLRLPIGTTVTEQYRVQMAKRHGAALSPVEYYAIEGPPDRGVSALVLKLKFVSGESAR